MFGQRKVAPQAAVDYLGVTVAYPCGNPRCVYRQSGPGAHFVKERRFSCPECGHTTFIDPDDLEYLLVMAHAQSMDQLRAAVAASIPHD